MSSITSFVGLYRPDPSEYYNVVTDQVNNWNRLDTIFDPTGSPNTQAPKALLRETVVAPVLQVATNLVNLQPIWNSPGLVQNGYFLNVTNDASHANSMLLDLQVAGVSMFHVRVDGAISLGSGVVTLAALHVTGISTLDGAVSVGGGLTANALHITGATTLDGAVAIGAGQLALSALASGTLPAGITVPGAQVNGALSSATIAGTAITGAGTLPLSLLAAGTLPSGVAVPAGSLVRPPIAKTGNYAAALTDEVILVDATAGVVTITLPLSGNSGHAWDIKKTDSSAHAVIAVGASGTIDSAANLSNAIQNNSYTIISDGTNGWVI